MERGGGKKKGGRKEKRREGKEGGAVIEGGRKKREGKKTGQPKSVMNWQMQRKVSSCLKGWRAVEARGYIGSKKNLPSSRDHSS